MREFMRVCAKPSFVGDKVAHAYAKASLAETG